MTGHALEKARLEAEALATQFKNTERPTRAQAKVLESAKRAAEDLQAKYNRLTDSVTHQRPEATKAEGKTETQKERETPARTGAPESETSHAEESVKSTGSARR